jgi:hypothetical protein
LIKGAKNKCIESGVDDCPHTHRARFNRYHDSCPTQSIILKQLCGLSERQYFGMGGRIITGNTAIVLSRYHFIGFAYDQRTYWNFPAPPRLLGLFDGLSHKIKKLHGAYAPGGSAMSIQQTRPCYTARYRNPGMPFSPIIL